MSQENQIIFGLDLGTNSVGWAVIRNISGIQLGEPDAKAELLGAGSRIFTPPVEEKTETPKNQERRKKRGMRRLISRRKMRRETLKSALTKNYLLPPSEEFERLLCKENPYQLRAEGLDKPLTPFQFGRLLFHICQRRGFKSNRKGSDDKDKEATKYKREMAELESDYKKSGARTLGEYLATQPKKRGKRTTRAMYEHEFDELWKAQSPHIPSLTDELKTRIHRIIFFQRPLKSQKGVVGLCQFERYTIVDEKGVTRFKGKKRLARSHPLAQWFIALQDINNLAIIGGPFNGPLNIDQRKKLMAAVKDNDKPTLTWAAAKKVLGPSYKKVLFNLEEGGKKKHIPGLITEHLIIEKALGNKWKKMEQSEMDSLYIALATVEDQFLLRRLTDGLGFSKDEAEALVKIELLDGYINLSLKAVNKLIPHMEQGMNYYDAQVAAGYVSTEAVKEQDFLSEPPEARNPVVQKALFEMRKVVNALIRKYGKPDIIRVELARDLKLSRDRKAELNKEQDKRQKENEAIDGRLRTEFGLAKPTRDDRDKFRLWEECGNICPYTGTSISADMLFRHGAVDVDHIIPWSRSLDNTYKNKTVCIASANSDKGNQTPWEKYSGDSQRWGEIEKRIADFPRDKKNKFYMQDIPSEITEGFAESALTDTRYISKSAALYLKTLGVKVQASKGGLTAILRNKWELTGTWKLDDNGNRVLADSILPAKEFDEKAKKDRSDHRHHALDAVVIALTSPSLVKFLSTISARDGKIRARTFPAPWETFREDVKKTMDQIIVSHRVSRKIRGALHDDTSYGPTEEAGRFVYRKKISELSMSEIENIRNPVITKMILDRLQRNGGDLASLKEPFLLPNKNGAPVPVRKVRFLKTMKPETLFAIKDSSGEPYRYLKYGSNHHVEIIKNKGTGKIEGRVVTMMEAARRARISKQSIIQRDHGPEWEFLMSLSIGEMLRLTIAGKEEYYRIQLMDVNGIITVRKHLSASADRTDCFNSTANALISKYKAVKVTISPIGEVSLVGRD